ncbi:MAG: methyltransferase [Rhizobiaceae bacterium]|nr:acetylserotonin O-methyltransferase [Hyphomicrobiales bacterium]NRB30387.1 methyltransferase [Rhizobiaceae bacterium]
MSLLDRWLDFRDACLTSHRFHQFASRFPLTRPVVRKRQSELFDLVSGFVYSQILLACIELDVLPKVKSGLTLAALSEQIDLPIDETRRLADGAVALRLLQKSKDTYRLGDLGSVLTVNPGVVAMIKHHPLLYKDMTDPVALLRSGRSETHLSRYWDYALSKTPADADPQTIEAYSQLMTASQTMVAEEVNQAFDFAPYATVMDVGGGLGEFISHIGRCNNHLKFKLFDLPSVVKTAECRLSGGELAGRVEFVGGSFFDDSLPGGADLITLVRILHDHDDAQVQNLLNAVHAALPKTGKLLICEPMSTGGSAHRISDAYFNFYLYAMGSGRPRPPEMLIDMLKKAGFSRARVVPTHSPLIVSTILADY